MPFNQFHRSAAHHFAAFVLRRAGYRDHFKRPVLHTTGEKAIILMQKRDPTRRVPKRLLEGIEKLAGTVAVRHSVVFGKVIEVERGRHSIVFHAVPSRK